MKTVQQLFGGCCRSSFADSCRTWKQEIMRMLIVIMRQRATCFPRESGDGWRKDETRPLCCEFPPVLLMVTGRESGM